MLLWRTLQRLISDFNPFFSLYLVACEYRDMASQTANGSKHMSFEEGTNDLDLRHVDASRSPTKSSDKDHTYSLLTFIE